MRIAVCDDNKDYRESLFNYVKFYFNEKHIPYECEEYNCGEKLLASNLKFDIVFLDIEMRAINGIKVTEQLNKKNKSTIIFIVTAYNNYLDDAMDLKVFRFIDKQLITPQRIYLSLDKALAQINQGDITVRTIDNDIIKVRKNEVMYIEVTRRETTIVTIDSCYKSKETLNYFKEQLISNYFVIPHSSFIVNLNYVKKYKRDEFIMKNDVKIYISQKKQPQIRKLFFAFTMED